MPNYQNTQIYKITSKNTNKVYIGASTQNHLSTVLSNFKTIYKTHCNNGFSESYDYFDIVKYNNVEITLLEHCGCANKQEVNEKKAFWEGYYGV